MPLTFETRRKRRGGGLKRALQPRVLFFCGIKVRSRRWMRMDLGMSSQVTDDRELTSTVTDGTFERFLKSSQSSSDRSEAYLARVAVDVRGQWAWPCEPFAAQLADVALVGRRGLSAGRRWPGVRSIRMRIVRRQPGDGTVGCDHGRRRTDGRTEGKGWIWIGVGLVGWRIEGGIEIEWFCISVKRVHEPCHLLR